MTSVDASQRLALLLRSKLPGFTGPAPKGVAGANAAHASKNQAGDLAGVVAQRIQALGKDDPDRRRKAFRIFLESLLLERLGPNLVQDSSFVAMVDAVQGQMEADAELAGAAAALGELLVTGSGRN